MMKFRNIAILAGVALLIVLGVARCSPDVNQELARTARIAVESAREAQDRNDAA